MALGMNRIKKNVSFLMSLCVINEKKIDVTPLRYEPLMPGTEPQDTGFSTGDTGILGTSDSLQSYMPETL